MDLIMDFTNWMWGWPLIIIIVGVSMVYSIGLGFFQFSKFGFIMKNTFGKIFTKETKGEGTLTPFQAVSSALAGTLGMGNIAGVGIAVGVGGPGALFWMWVVAFVAAVAKYAEIALGIKYREKDPETGEYRGGFMYMVTNGLGKNWKWLALVWSFLLFAQFTISGAVQSNSLADVMRSSFDLSPLVVGIITAVLTGIVMLGGIKRIGKLAEKVVPTMAIIYFLGAFIILVLNLGQLPGVFNLIFTSAFSGMAPVGGFVGSTFMLMIRQGFARGVYSNEAGMGTSPIVHSTATTDHPARQGMWGIFEVFIDTIVVCSITGLVILVTGEWQSGEIGASLTATAFRTGLPGNFGHLVVTFATLFFAYTTILLAGYYAEAGGQYCFGNKISIPFRLLYVLILVFGAVGGLQFIWGLFDFFMALTVAINLIVLLFMFKDVRDLTKDFFTSGKYIDDKKDISA
ncbi:sodium:alanine symporter family protein [Alkalicella caledoniensis]|uniref:Sodium:alanine symporter family protein n=1 Tax=Alkalicella caledoniensis TaxID=2731377 RepID=A0A7G9W7M9_ALKCA|nr:sodium:alanine symporter family protein [Alkalicella caledoniensis]QNO14691.1 sodium:alanine symporter family protein [Alkalicella caledoniensis]